MALTRVDVVLLAGGASTRMGRDKASLPLAGRRLVDHVLDDLATLVPHAVRRVVAVAPPQLVLPGWVLQTMEDPPGGGPVAGLFAGLTALDAAPDELVLLLTCDAPRAARLAIPLIEAAAGGTTDAVLARTGDRVQYLLGVYRVAALRRRLAELAAGGSGHGLSMRALVAGLEVMELEADDRLAVDLDEPADVSRWLSDAAGADASVVPSVQLGDDVADHGPQHGDGVADPAG